MNYNIQPHNPSTNEITRLTRASQDRADQKRDKALYAEQMKMAKRVGALVLATIALPYGANALDRAIDQPQAQSTKHAKEYIQDNPDSPLAQKAK